MRSRRRSGHALKRSARGVLSLIEHPHSVHPKVRACHHAAFRYRNGKIVVRTARASNPAVKANTSGKTLLRWVWRYEVAMIY
jgi:hypothetical protein